MAYTIRETSGNIPVAIFYQKCTEPMDLAALMGYNIWIPSGSHCHFHRLHKKVALIWGKSMKNGENAILILGEIEGDIASGNLL